MGSFATTVVELVVASHFFRKVFLFDAFQMTRATQPSARICGAMEPLKAEIEAIVFN